MTKELLTSNLVSKLRVSFVEATPENLSAANVERWQAADEIERLRVALKVISEGGGDPDPYEYARVALAMPASSTDETTPQQKVTK